MATALETIYGAITLLASSVSAIESVVGHHTAGTVDLDALSGDQARAVADSMKNIAAGVAGLAQQLASLPIPGPSA